jgi:SNF2 family DNA or RNA helicase
MGTGKTLAAQMVIEMSGKPLWWWAGRRPACPTSSVIQAVGLPVRPVQVEFFTYEGLVRVMDEWDGRGTVPFGFIGDESSRCKNCTSQRSRACQKLADLIRDKYGFDGYVIEMSGTPSPKTPVDWWSQCEIAWPGFLKEGSPKAMEERLAFMVQQEYDAGPFKKRIGWKDDENKCAECGALRHEGPHDLMDCDDPDDYHPFKASTNEVAYLYDRLKGLVVIKHKKDCLNLPDKRYRRIVCKPTPSILRVAQAVVNSAPNAVTGMTLLRELSDGFQYREVQEGTSRCTHCKDGTVEEWSDPDNPDKTYSTVEMLDPTTVERLVKQIVPCPKCGGAQEVPKIVRYAREIPCPKDEALKMLLDENEETGRIVIFAGFTGSVDRIVKLCLREKWDVVRCDQGNFQTFAATSDSPEGRLVTDEEPLDYWANLNNHGKVAFVANPESGGMSLTLVEARMAVYWSNSWKPEYRMQSEDRIHRKGMDVNLGCTIVDLIHLPSDERVLRVLRDNRRLELMSMGEIMSDVDWNDSSEDGEMVVEEAAQ